MEPLTILLVVVITALTILLLVVGIQVIVILKELKHSLQRINATLDGVDRIVNNIASPFANMGGMMEGLKSGFKVAETFISWLKKTRLEEDEEES